VTELYKYQRQGIRQIERFDGRALLADEMGLGKTIQALWWADNYMEQDASIVVVCPASLKINWQREAAKHCNMRMNVLEGYKPFDLMPGRYIINYDILVGHKRYESSWLEKLIELRPKLVVCDEAHYIKSPAARRSKAVAALCFGVPHVIMISGTPLTNRPAELYNILKILHPNEFPSYSQYCWRYCNPRVTPWGLDVSGASNLDELHERLTNLCMIRRRKADVLKQLPDKIRTVLPIELNSTAKAEYDRAERQFIAWLREFSPSKAKRAEKAEYLVKRGYLKRLAGILKQKSVIEWIGNFLQETDEKLIFFGVHKAFLRPIYDHFKKVAVMVDGSITGSKRQSAFDAFTNQDKKRLLVGNIQAAGVGWNGQVANNVAFGELPWTPGELTQAEDRTHRIGQTRGVVCHYLVSEGTIEEQLCNILQAKQQTLSNVLDGHEDVELDIMVKLNQALLDKHLDKKFPKLKRTK